MNFIKENKPAFICIVVAFVTIICSVILILCTESPKLIKNNNEIFKDSFVSIVSSPQILTEIALKYDLGPEKTEILVNHYLKMFDEGVTDYYMQRLDASGAFRNGIGDPTYIISFISRMNQELSRQGLLRVSKKDRFAYFTYLRHQSEVLSNRTCKLYLNGDNSIYSRSDFQNSNQAVLKQLSTQEFENYLKAFRNAVHAQLKGYPEKVILSLNDKERAKEVYLNSLKEQFKVMDAEGRERLSLVAEQKENANSADLCDYGKVIYEATASIQNEDDRDLVIMMLMRITQ